MSYTLAIWRQNKNKIDFAQQYQKIISQSNTKFQTEMMGDFLELSNLAPNSQFALLDEKSILVNIPIQDMSNISSIAQYCLENSLICYDPQTDQNISYDFSSRQQIKAENWYSNFFKKVLQQSNFFEESQSSFESLIQPNGSLSMFLNLIGCKEIHVSADFVISNPTIFEFLKRLSEKGVCPPACHLNFNLNDLFTTHRWQFDALDQSNAEVQILNFVEFVESTIRPLAIRWCNLDLTTDDLEKLSKVYKAEYLLISERYLSGAREQAKLLASQFLASKDDKVLYQKFIGEIFNS